jgi:hypothetical protein
VSVAAPARTAPRRAPQTRPAPAEAPRPARRRPAPARRISAGGLAWVVLLAAMLGGIVALNVAALRSGIDANHMSQQATVLGIQNRTLENEVQKLTAPWVIAKRARSYGMVQTSPWRYLPLRPGTHRQGVFSK